MEAHRKNMERCAAMLRVGNGELPVKEARRNMASILKAALIGWDKSSFFDNDDDGNEYEVEYTEEFASAVLDDPANEEFIEDLDRAVANRGNFRIGTEDDRKN